MTEKKEYRLVITDSSGVEHEIMTSLSRRLQKFTGRNIDEFLIVEIGSEFYNYAHSTDLIEDIRRALLARHKD